MSASRIAFNGPRLEDENLLTANFTAQSSTTQKKQVGIPSDNPYSNVSEDSTWRITPGYALFQLVGHDKNPGTRVPICRQVLNGAFQDVWKAVEAGRMSHEAAVAYITSRIRFVGLCLTAIDTNRVSEDTVGGLGYFGVGNSPPLSTPCSPFDHLYLEAPNPKDGIMGPGFAPSAIYPRVVAKKPQSIPLSAAATANAMVRSPEATVRGGMTEKESALADLLQGQLAAAITVIWKLVEVGALVPNAAYDPNLPGAADRAGANAAAFELAKLLGVGKSEETSLKLRREILLALTQEKTHANYLELIGSGKTAAERNDKALTSAGEPHQTPEGSLVRLQISNIENAIAAAGRVITASKAGFIGYSMVGGVPGNTVKTFYFRPE